jgi:hypothetical protein
MFGLSSRYYPLLPSTRAAIARVKPLFATFTVQMIYEYKLNGNNNILINYLGNVQESWIDK